MSAPSNKREIDPNKPYPLEFIDEEIWEKIGKEIDQRRIRWLQTYDEAMDFYEELLDEEMGVE